jgi:DNA-directed RNA polymerase subunit H (RpoH/RPB5)
MDISKVLKHSVELLELRGENTEKYKIDLNKIKENRFFSEAIHQSTENITVIYILSKDNKPFKDWWQNFKGLPFEELEKFYKSKKFIIILQEYPSSITLQAMQNKNIALQNIQPVHNNGFLQIFTMKELMYNPTKHELVPKHEKMTEPEIKKLMEDLQLKSKTQLPLIQKQDIIARWLGLQQTDIVRITRYTETSGEYYYYRCCV